MPTFEKTLIMTDFTSTDVAFAAAVWQKLGTHTNDDPNSVNYVGGKHAYVYMKLLDDTTDAVEETGEHRLVIADPNEIIRKIVWQGRSELASASQTDKTKKLKLDLRKPGYKYKSKLIWEFKSDAADTVDVSASTCNLDITQVIA